MNDLTRLYPEINAGGFSRVDGTIAFYTRVNALLRPEMTVLDIGAGRGQQLLETAVPYRSALARLQGKVSKVVGADVDGAVLDNPFLDEAHIIRPDAALPFPDGSFDLVMADWVLEHVAEPGLFASEVHRVLKPGGWFCARTPNRWGMTGIATNIIPNSWHVRLLKTLQPGREAVDVFPTVYGLNTRGKLRRHFPPSLWEHASFIGNAEPPYVQRSTAATVAVNLAWRLLPNFFYTVLNVFVRKKA